MKTTLLALTGVACLVTSGIAMVAAERSSVSSPVTAGTGGDSGDLAHLDRDARGQYGVRWREVESEMESELETAVGSEVTSAMGSSGLLDIHLDISRDGFLSANELRPYTKTYLARNGRSLSIVDRFDPYGDSVLATDEFRPEPSRR